MFSCSLQYSKSSHHYSDCSFSILSPRGTTPFQHIILHYKLRLLEVV